MNINYRNVKNLLEKTKLEDENLYEALRRLDQAIIDISSWATISSETGALTIKRAIIMAIGDPGGSVLTTGVKVYIYIPFACTILEWTLLANASGSIVIDIWKDTYANFPPTVADTITGTEKPTLSSSQKNQDLDLNTWTTFIPAGSVLAVNIDSVTTIKQFSLTIMVQS